MYLPIWTSFQWSDVAHEPLVSLSYYKYCLIFNLYNDKIYFSDSMWIFKQIILKLVKNITLDLNEINSFSFIFYFR